MHLCSTGFGGSSDQVNSCCQGFYVNRVFVTILHPALFIFLDQSSTYIKDPDFGNLHIGIRWLKIDKLICRIWIHYNRSLSKSRVSIEANSVGTGYLYSYRLTQSGY